MSKRKKTNSNGLLLAMVFLGAVVVGALAFYVTTTTPTEGRIEPKIERKNRPANVQEQPSSATFYIYDAKNDWAPVAVQVQGNEPIKSLVTNYLGRVAESSGVELLSADLKNGHAVLNFSKTFEGMGSDAESEFAEGLLRILGQFPQVKTADFLNQGEIMETGHQVYEGLAVIRQGETADAEAQSPGL